MINKALQRKLISIHLVSWGSQKSQAMGFSKQNITLHVHDDACFSVGSLCCCCMKFLDGKFFFEKRQQINFSFPSKLWLNSFKIVVISLPSHRNWKTHFRTEAKIKFFMRPNYGSLHRNLILVSKLKWWL